MARRGRATQAALLFALSGFGIFLVWSSLREEGAADREEARPIPAEEEAVEAEEEPVGEPGTGWQGELFKLATPWAQPQRIRFSGGDYEVESVIQDGSQFQVLVQEGAGADGPAAVVSRLGGGPAAFAFNYDTSTGRLEPPEGVKRVAVSAASGESTLDALDWTLRVDGDQGRHLAVSSEYGDLVYDASLGVQVPAARGFTALYAFDAKKRASTKGFFPNWARHSLGLQRRGFKLSMHQRNPDLGGMGLDFEAVYSGTSSEAPGSPKYTVRAVQDGSEPATLEGKVQLTGPEGVKGGLHLAIKDGRPSLSGHSELSASRTVRPGVDLEADTKVVVTPTGAAWGDRLAVHPVNLKASADLAELLPSLASEGSEVSVNARYKPGETKGAMGFSAKLNPKGPVVVAAEGSVDDKGRPSGSFRVGAATRGFAGRYHTSTAPGAGARHVGELYFPPRQFQRGSARAYGRVTQSRTDYGGQPRLQLGVQYDVGLGSKGLRLSGEDAIYDSGSVLLTSDGKPWTNPRLQKAHNSAAAVRKQAESSEGMGQRWLRG